jgi:hypothetical protein|nr:MAG TPA: hypothetical protein [Caudoviricetes sp.]
MTVRQVSEIFKLTPALTKYVNDKLDEVGLKDKVYSTNPTVILNSEEKKEIPFYTVERPLNEKQKEELLAYTDPLEKQRFVAGLLRDMFYTITYTKEDQAVYKLHLGPLSTDNADVGFSVYIESNSEGDFLVLEFSFLLEDISSNALV